MVSGVGGARVKDTGVHRFNDLHTGRTTSPTSDWIVSSCPAGTAGQAVLDCVNDVLSDSTDAWNLSPRVRRLAIPLLHYGQLDAHNMDFLIASRAGAAREVSAVGFVAVETLRCAPSDNAVNARSLHLHGIYVRARARRNGIGRILFHAVIEMALARALTRIETNAWRDSATFFERLGFSLAPGACRSEPPYRMMKSLAAS